MRTVLLLVFFLLLMVTGLIYLAESASPLAYVSDVSNREDSKRPSPPRQLAKIKFGPVRVVDVEVYQFKTRQFFLDGRPFDWVSADWQTEKQKLYWLSDYEVAYEACRFSRTKEEKLDEGCENWTVLDLTTRRKDKLTLPGFDHFSAVPTVQKPFIAYGSISEDDRIGCAVYDWQLKKIIVDLYMVTDHYVHATDAPGILPPPVFSKDGKSITCTSTYATGEKKFTVKFRD